MSTADNLATIIAGLRPIHDDIALPDTCDVLRVVQTSDGRGGVTETEVLAGTYRCAVDASGLIGHEAVSGSIESVDRPYTITLPYNADVTEQDAIESNGRRFEIETARRGEGYEIATEVAAREVG